MVVARTYRTILKTVDSLCPETGSLENRFRGITSHQPVRKQCDFLFCVEVICSFVTLRASHSFFFQFGAGSSIILDVCAQFVQEHFGGVS